MSTTVQVPPRLPDQVRRGGTARRQRRSKGGDEQGRANPLAKLAVLVLALAWFVPVLGLLITSFRTRDAANSSGWWTVFLDPSTWGAFTLDNYAQVLDQANLARAFTNSFAIALPATIIPILIAAFAAYAFAFMEFPGRDVLFFVIISLLVVPNFVAFVPLLRLYGELGINGTFPAAWLAHIGFGMSLAVYILRNYMATLPREVIESAKIDGASHFSTFWRLILPMSVPALASFAIFQFLWVWNDLLVALVFLGSGENAPITIAVNSLIGQQGQGWQLVTAGGFLSMIVPILIFLTMQRFFVRGLTAGAVKG
ncbi:carbohydrate ABC transporter permease [Cellulomonas marina]|uniref:Alpha-glucoside transport system permease protein n=1 Tax=Cellulomonas marina TaxID=988821 RepID=A0A1I1A608_9CELL|nr:carbohydrate ABC transporter permease [Cellulomonas marina]GIG29585.1 sugar ABC transporter permease [Cellulomonas marina]SFB33391.1 alpha-glucoside transport system permease protein [Cellulomonas marina]